MKNRQSSKGISLITLVITIVIMIILAAAVILALDGSGTVYKATEAVFKSDLKELQQQFVEFNAKKALDSTGAYNSTSLVATTNKLEYNTKTDTKEKDIYTIFPEMPDYLKGRVRINRGNLIFDNYKTTENPTTAEEERINNENNWAVEAGYWLNDEISGNVLESSEFAMSFIEPDGTLTIPGWVRTIGVSAYYGCTNITKVIIPSSVVSINSNSFRGATNLKEVEIKGSALTTIGANAFYGCTNLENINLPNSLTSIGATAFYNCKKITSINLADSITTIGSEAFRNCTTLTKVTLPSGLINKSGNEKFGTYVFAGCTSLVEVKLPDTTNFTIVPSYTFNGCTSLSKVNPVLLGKNVNFPSYITAINSYSFANTAITGEIDIPLATNTLNSTSFPSNVTFVYAPGASIYQNNEFWVSNNRVIKIYEDAVKTGGILTIPDGVTEIDSAAITTALAQTVSKIVLPASYTGSTYALTLMTSLATIEVNPSNTSFEVGADGSLYSKNGSTLRFYIGGFNGLSGKTLTTIGTYAVKRNITSITIPSQITTISGSAFAYSNALTTVNFESGSQVTTIGTYAFNGCTALSNINMSNLTKLTAISDYTFYNCDALTTMDLSNLNSLTRISYLAFYSCDNLTQMNIPASVTTLDPLFIYVSSKLANATTYNNGIVFSEGSPFRVEGNMIIKGSTLICLINNPTGTVVVPNGVTIIGNQAFNNKTNVVGVEIPSSVTSISTSAFSNCSNLSRIKINQNKRLENGTINPLNANSPFGAMKGARIIEWLDF